MSDPFCQDESGGKYGNENTVDVCPSHLGPSDILVTQSQDKINSQDADSIGPNIRNGGQCIPLSLLLTLRSEWGNRGEVGTFEVYNDTIPSKGF